MALRFPVAPLVLGFACAAFASCTKKLPHSGEDPVYPLRGLHAAVPCVGCHGDGTPDTLPTACAACHESDRLSPDHYPGQDCGGACHVEDGWDVVNPTLVFTGETGITDTGPVPDFDHSTLPETQLCWDCHEEDRKDPKHYAAGVKPGEDADPVTDWDCSGCHTATAWGYQPILHPARIPHGVEDGDPDDGLDCSPRPEKQWNSGCVGCHPNGTDTFTCFSCHDGPKKPVHGGQFAEKTCLTCHVDAEAENCVSE